MRVTIAERLGFRPSKDLTAVPKPILDDPECDERAPEFIEPENVLRLADLPSAKTAMLEAIPEQIDDYGPRRVRGEMVWLHKTAPTLVIEGRPGLSPDDHAAGRRR